MYPAHIVHENSPTQYHKLHNLMTEISLGLVKTEFLRKRGHGGSKFLKLHRKCYKAVFETSD